MSIFTLDVLERTIWTFLEGFAAAWIVDGALANVELGWQARLTIGATAGIAAVLKAVVLARHIGDEDSAATLTSPPDHAGPRVPPLPKG